MKKICLYLKKSSVFVFATLLLLLLVACDDETFEQNEVHINNEFFESYAYRIDMDSSFYLYVPDFIHGTLVHDGRIYFYYVETDVVEAEVDIDGNIDIDTLEPPVSTIIIESMYPDGTRVSKTEIENAGKFISISGFRITEAGNFVLLFTDSNFAHFDDGTQVIYAEYSSQGIELARHEITGFAQRGNGGFYLRQVLFVDDGMVLLVSTDDSTFLYVVDEHFSVHSQTELEMGTQAMIPMVQTEEGRLFVYFTERAGGAHRSTLREFNRESADWGERFPISGTDIRAMYPASGDTSFDFYIDYGIYLFGYSLESEEKTTILNWTESQTSAGAGSHLNFLDTGEISILTDRGFFTDDRYVEHTILARVDRADLPDYTTITLGGVNISHNLYTRQHVMDFNQRSQTHQIEIIDYFPTGGDNVDYIAARTRFAIDLITGRAPDIIMGHMDIMAPITDAGLLLDLYEFIDADPVLERSDFIPSILESLEAHDGSLPAIYYYFTLFSLSGMAGTVQNSDTWNFDEMLSLIEGAVHAGVATIISNSLQFEMSSTAFVNRALADPELGFIDMVENTANLDSEEFIHILELATAYFPLDTSIEWDAWDAHMRYMASLDATSVAAGRMMRGEVLFHQTNLRQIHDYQVYQRLFGDDKVYLGWPTQIGSRHEALLSRGLGISATSNSPDEAWEFVRKFLLPDSNMNISAMDSIFDLFFPMRIDLLEYMISEAMTPRLRVDENGNEIEVSQNFPYREFEIPFTVSVYAMTEVEAEGFRAIIANASARSVVEDTIRDMVAEELAPLYAGSRSATDTARVLQNRIQRFLSERG